MHMKCVKNIAVDVCTGLVKGYQKDKKKCDSSIDTYNGLLILAGQTILFLSSPKLDIKIFCLHIYKPYSCSNVCFSEKFYCSLILWLLPIDIRVKYSHLLSIEFHRNYIYCSGGLSLKKF